MLPTTTTTTKEAPVKTAESCLETAHSPQGKAVVHPLKSYFPSIIVRI